LNFLEEQSRSCERKIVFAVVNYVWWTFFTFYLENVRYWITRNTYVCVACRDQNMYVHTYSYVHMYVWHVVIRICRYVHTYTCTYVCVVCRNQNIYIHSYVCMYLCMYVCVCACRDQICWKKQLSHQGHLISLSPAMYVRNIRNRSVT
jgi:hypothetical protein